MPSAPTVTGDFPYEAVPGWHRGLERAGIVVHEFPDVAIGAEDQVYLLSREPSMVVVLDSDGNVIDRFWHDSLSQRPHGITIGPDGTVYVVDQPKHDIKVFDSTGVLIRTIGSGRASDTGVDLSLPVPEWTATVRRMASPFNNPTKVAVTADGELLVTDGYGNAAVHRFSLDGEFRSSQGGPGIQPGHFMLPHSAIVTANGDILVADREADRLQRFAADGTHLRDITTVRRPTSIAERPDGLLVVGELAWRKGEHAARRGLLLRGSPARISLLRPDGTPVGRLGAMPGPVRQGSVVAPHGVAIDSTGSLYVAEVSATFMATAQPFTIQKFAARW